MQSSLLLRSSLPLSPGTNYSSIISLRLQSRASVSFRIDARHPSLILSERRGGGSNHFSLASEMSLEAVSAQAFFQKKRISELPLPGPAAVLRLEFIFRFFGEPLLFFL